jgi:membrane protein DedA with SNARE-associated domain
VLLASILTFAANIGYPSMFLLVMAESGGMPVPGETALVTGALLASQHKLNIILVIVIAASAAIIGDNVGYLIGRKGGRWLLKRPGPLARSRHRALEIGVPFFARHGPRAVFFGRWLIGLRTWASWLAGATLMPWKSFAVWNAAGGASWATTIRAGRVLCRLGRPKLHCLIRSLRAGHLRPRASRHSPVAAPSSPPGWLDR